MMGDNLEVMAGVNFEVEAGEDGVTHEVDKVGGISILGSWTDLDALFCCKLFCTGTIGSTNPSLFRSSENPSRAMDLNPFGVCTSLPFKRGVCGTT